MEENARYNSYKNLLRYVMLFFCIMLIVSFFLPLKVADNSMGAVGYAVGNGKTLNRLGLSTGDVLNPSMLSFGKIFLKAIPASRAIPYVCFGALLALSPIVGFFLSLAKKAIGSVVVGLMGLVSYFWIITSDVIQSMFGSEYYSMDIGMPLIWVALIGFLICSILLLILKIKHPTVNAVEKTDEVTESVFSDENSLQSREDGIKIQK